MATKRCDEWALISDESALRSNVASIPLWDLVQDSGVFKLSRSFVAKDFVAALTFITRVGEVAEMRGHHPDLHLTGYRNVQVIVYTHSLSGLTDNDFDLAKAIDMIPASYSPKWLAENPKALTAAAVASSTDCLHMDYGGKLHEERVLP